MFIILPILFVTYKFIKWFRYSRFLRGIIKINKFGDIIAYAIKNGKNQFFVSIYTYINSNEPLLNLKTISTPINNSIVSTSTTTSVVANTIDTLISIPASILNKIIDSSTSTITNPSLSSSPIQPLFNSAQGYLAIESTHSLLFQGNSHATGVLSSILSKHHVKVSSLKLTDMASNSIKVLTDNVALPLEKSFTAFIPTKNEEFQYYKILDYLFGRKKIIGQLFEEHVLKPNSKLFTVLSCKVDEKFQNVDYKLIDSPFQFSEINFEKEISNADFKTHLYGGFLVGFGVSILAYYGIPLVRDYLFKLKLDRTKTSTPEEMERTCSVCYEQSKEIVFIPCNHVITCNACSTLIHQCPLCRAQITSKRRLIFA